MERELKIKILSSVVNRSKGQTEMLSNFCGDDLNKLMLLEQKIKENHISYCPGSKEMVNEILSMPKVEDPWIDLYKEYMLKMIKLNDNK